MKQLVHVTEVRPVGTFKLLIRFSDGTEGERDFAAYLQQDGPMLEPLKDPAYFAGVFIEFGALTWPNGFDLDPQNLHDQMQREKLLRRSVAA